MIRIDLLNPRSDDTATALETPDRAQPQRKSGGLSLPNVSFSLPGGATAIVGVNILILIVIITLVMYIPADNFISEALRPVQKAFTRLFNMF